MPPRSRGTPTVTEAPGPRMVPILMIGKGRVYLPGPEGPEVAHSSAGGNVDVLDVADRLAERFKRVYVVDLDGLRDDKAQLDYLQELSRDLELWVDAGIRTGDQAIDILVAGASRAVLSTAHLGGPRELQRAWKLSQELAFEVELREGHVVSRDAAWRELAPTAIAANVRDLGISELIVSPRNAPVDWGLVTALATTGSVWVDGSFEPEEASPLAASGANGAFFHLNEFLKE